MTRPQMPRPARARARARLAGTPLTRAAAGAAMLLALAGSAPASAQDRALHLFSRATTADSAMRPLPAGTRLLVFAEPRGTAKGKNAQLNTIPPGDSVQRNTDSITTVRDGHGVTATKYADSMRYLVIARTSDGLFWSVDPDNRAQPRYHSLDQVPRIRMAAVRESHRGRLDSLFAAAPAPVIDPRGADPAPARQPEEPMVRLRGHEIAALLISAMVLGLAGGWLARDEVSRRRVAVFKARAAQNREARGRSGGEPDLADEGGGIQMNGWVPYSSRTDQPQDPEPDLPPTDQLTELASTICEHVTEQVKLAEGRILGHLESSGIRPAPPSGADELDHYQRLFNNVDLSGRLALTSGEGGRTHGAAARTAAVFLWWCQNAGGNVNRVKGFTEMVRSQLPDAEVQVLARDRDNNAVTFVSDGAGDPIEYWLVTVKGENMLFPRPLNQKSFKQLYPVYEGDAGPHSLRSIEPAFVRHDGARWVLDSPGRVS
jgi:hypothetical protein